VAWREAIFLARYARHASSTKVCVGFVDMLSRVTGDWRGRGDAARMPLGERHAAAPGSPERRAGYSSAERQLSEATRRRGFRRLNRTCSPRPPTGGRLNFRRGARRPLSGRLNFGAAGRRRVGGLSSMPPSDPTPRPCVELCKTLECNRASEDSSCNHTVCMR